MNKIPFKILINTIILNFVQFQLMYSCNDCVNVWKFINYDKFNSAIRSCLEIGIGRIKSQWLLPLSPVGALWTQQLMAHRSFSSSESSDSLVPLGVCWVWESLGCCGDSAPFRLHRTAMVPLKSTTASHTCPAHKCSYEPRNLAWRTIKGVLLCFFTFWILVSV